MNHLFGPLDQRLLRPFNPIDELKLAFESRRFSAESFFAPLQIDSAGSVGKNTIGVCWEIVRVSCCFSASFVYKGSVAIDSARRDTNYIQLYTKRILGLSCLLFAEL